MSDAWYLGNDIVDLADPRHRGKAGERRFLERVCTSEEEADIRSSQDPDRALWIRWAGKEAAFKTVSKAHGIPPTFVHADFEVSLPRPRSPSPPRVGQADPPMTRIGTVRHGALLLPLRVELAGTALHAVTWVPRRLEASPPFSWGFEEISEVREPWREALREQFSAKEWECVSHRASALARLAARRALASVLGVEERELEIGCGPGSPGRRIPKVFLAGREIPVDLSLSHHGRLLAWTFLPLPRR